MKELIKVKNTIRDFLRKYEEIIFPILKFIWCYLVFHSVHTMFNYMELFDRKLVILLLAVMSAMLPDGFLVFLSGVVIGCNCYSVNLEVGLSFTLLFLLMYCLYIRFFPKYSYVLFMIPLCYMINMPFLAPLLVVVFAGIGGALPAAFGVVLYYFSVYTRDIAGMLSNAEDEETVEVLQYYIDHILKNKEILLLMLVFMLTIVIASVIHKLSFPFSWYAALFAGGLVCILSYLILGNSLGVQKDMSSCIAGTLMGFLIAAVVQTAKGVLDFPHTERVQFEDDEYYYYVKAVPKLDAPEKKKKSAPEEREGEVRRKPLTPEERARREAARAAAGEGRPPRNGDPRRRPLTPEERARREAARAAAMESGELREGDPRRRPLTPEERARREAARAAAMESGELREGDPRRRPLTPEERARREAARAAEASGKANGERRSQSEQQPVNENPDNKASDEGSRRYDLSPEERIRREASKALAEERRADEQREKQRSSVPKTEEDIKTEDKKASEEAAPQKEPAAENKPVIKNPLDSEENDG